MKRGKHVELFLVDGQPGGITTVEIAGWAGHVLSGPRSELGEFLARKEAQRNGVYLLIGSDPASIDGVTCYIGKSENLRDRIKNHDGTKQFWDRAILICSRDDSFNEGHWGYLENRLLDIARDAQRCSLPNIQTPRLRRLSEAQIADAEAFLDEVRIILPVLGVNVLRTNRQPQQERLESPVFRLTVPKRGVDARAQVIDGEFLLLEGSLVVPRWVNSGTSEATRRTYAAYRNQHEKLLADGSIEVRDGIGYVTRNVAFPSPSSAGSLASGRSCNGRTSWLWDGGTYGDWENRGIHD